jgi:hypothetical protein
LPSPETTVSEIARNAGAETVGGLTEPLRGIVNVAGTRASVEPPAGFLTFVPCDPPPADGWGETPPDPEPVVVWGLGVVTRVLVVGGDVSAVAVGEVEVCVLAVVVAPELVGALELLEDGLEPPQPAIAAAAASAAQIVIGRLIDPSIGRRQTAPT